MINLSLTSSTIPSARKSAIITCLVQVRLGTEVLRTPSSTRPEVRTHDLITPILKKPTADLDELNNFRPISNLPYIAKLLE